MKLTCHETANDLINALLSKTEAAGTPEKVAENNRLMKCVIMRVIVTARQSLSPNYQALLKRFILAQMLSLHNESTVPSEYEALLPFLLTPAVWAQKGNIPGFVKLLKAYLKRGASPMVSRGQLASVLAVVQQRLIPSRVNDVWGIMSS
ncbi:importin-alpha export receptor [Paramarasmius palmivorus]|uniref:Importin-alpha export receptor n=1 Tax=Paramarasmius palmivorus TaxID=297713 RepID=A0AAW0BBY7_9AGAR